MAIGEPITFDSPDNTCFGCGRGNPQGLQLEFVHTSERGVEGRYTAPAHFNGAPGVVHGGMQATLLDEAVGFAMHAYHSTVDELGDDEEGWRRTVTVEFDLRYRRPVPTETELLLRAEIVRVVGRDYLAVAEILVNDEVCTSATAKWKKLSA